MRLLKLDLEKYGSFTNCQLHFDEAARLHLVYGRNEAGKSTALAAITDLFFGFSTSSPYGFLHQGRELRLGATLAAKDHTKFSFRRKAGAKNTLLDAQDRPLNEDALFPFLGGLSKPVFCRAFGLNAAALRSGAETLLGAEGDVGASLLAAASGLRNLTSLRQKLETEAEQIFAPRKAKDRKFYQAYERFEAASAAIKKTELRESDWKKLNENIETHAQNLAQFNDTKKQLAQDAVQLRRLKRVAPLIQEIDRKTKELEGLNPLPDLPQTFTKDAATALEKARENDKMLETLHRDIGKAEKDFAQIEVFSALLEHGPAIQTLFTETGNYAKAREDIVRLRGEMIGFEGQLRGKGQQLGISALEELYARQPRAALLARLDRLKEDGRRLETEKQTRLKNMRQEEDAIAELQRSGLARGKASDPAPIRERFEALRPSFNQIEPHKLLAEAIDLETRFLSEMQARLLPRVTDLEALALLPLPQPQSLQRFQMLFSEANAQEARLVEQIEGMVQSIADLNAHIAEANAERPIPTSEAIAQLRAQRDALWVEIKTNYLARPETLKTERFVALSSNYEMLCRKADDLADLANEDAERVAAHTQAHKRLREETRRLVVTQAKLEEAEKSRRRLEAEWRALWEPAKLTPLPPQEMQSWLHGLSSLLERREKLQKQQRQSTHMRMQIENIKPELSLLSRALELEPQPDEDLARFVTRVEKRLVQCETQFKSVIGREAAFDAARSRLDKLTAQVEESAMTETEWSKLWEDALVELGAKPKARIEEVEASLTIWREIPSLTEKLESHRARVNGMQRDIVSAFELMAMPLIEALAPDLKTMPADQAIKLLHERLDQAGKADVQRRECARRRSDLQEQLERAETLKCIFDEELARLAELADWPVGTLDELLRELAIRDTIALERQRKYHELLASAEGKNEDELRADLSGFEPDRVEAELAELEEQRQRLDDASHQAFLEQGKLKEQRAQLEQGTGAELALQQRRNAEAELQEAARDWAVLKIAALLIEETLERNRLARKDPLMARAGEIFAGLTDHAWIGLDQEFDAQDKPILIGRRKDQKLVEIQGMSEGTRDQLYLSLRLAFLEDYASKGEAAPFIGDDLFTSFDEPRTRLGLMALGSVSSKIQPILFTHHQHVVEIAQTYLGKGCQVIELGDA